MLIKALYTLIRSQGLNTKKIINLGNKFLLYTAYIIYTQPAEFIDAI